VKKVSSPWYIKEAFAPGNPHDAERTDMEKTKIWEKKMTGYHGLYVKEGVALGLGRSKGDQSTPSEKGVETPATWKGRSLEEKTRLFVDERTSTAHLNRRGCCSRLFYLAKETNVRMFFVLKREIPLGRGLPSPGRYGFLLGLSPRT